MSNLDLGENWRCYVTVLQFDLRLPAHICSNLSKYNSSIFHCISCKIQVHCTRVLFLNNDTRLSHIHQSNTVIIKNFVATWNYGTYSKILFSSSTACSLLKVPKPIEVPPWINISFSLIKPNTSTLLTHCGLVTPYGDANLGQHWLR